MVAVLLIPAAIAGVLLVFNTGQLTANKLKVQNAADAAAFSAMELQARQMNLDAYLNRAMLVNEIAIGQAVSIVSWSRYLEHVADNIKYPFAAYKGAARLLDIVLPGAGSALVRLLDFYQKAIEDTAKLTAEAGNRYGSFYVGAGNTYDAIYAGASQILNATFNVSTPGGPVAKTVEQIVRLNAGDRARALNYTPAGLVALNAPYWNARRNYVTTWGGSADGGRNDPGGRARMASMINEGRGEFTRNRSHHVGPPLSFPPILGFRAGTDKQGGSQFAKDENGNYVWSGADTIKTQIQMRKFILFGGWKTLYGESWGWGGTWSFPGRGSFDYYQSADRAWSYPYMEGAQSADNKTMLQRDGQVYNDAWRQDSRGMNRVVADYSDRLVGDYMPSFGVGRGAHKGIATYRDLKWETTDSQGKRVTREKVDLTDTAPRFVVVVDLPRGAVRDSVTALGISSDPDAGNARLGWLNMHLETKGAGQNEGVRAAAAAQVYFRRPAELWPRSDGLDERANLFSPFWSARLVDLTQQERAAIAALNLAE
ncbi:pilus assembly protein TadG-related protein [Acidithiobacillus sp.]|uniref:pilus assembly protein TadG-related protein n=1 Tax=Acidithiobacillus sp. TaxID=1872118 RepID=UPI0025C54186|nr:pilus assembly protein TadG-related protein [Acidithiobacillus sp.]